MITLLLYTVLLSTYDAPTLIHAADASNVSYPRREGRIEREDGGPQIGERDATLAAHYTRRGRQTFVFVFLKAYLLQSVGLDGMSAYHTKELYSMYRLRQLWRDVRKER